MTKQSCTTRERLAEEWEIAREHAADVNEAAEPLPPMSEAPDRPVTNAAYEAPAKAKQKLDEHERDHGCA